jgi:alanine racemase
VHNDEQLAWFARHEAPTTLWVKLDTGMHRLGFAPAEARRVVEALQRPGRELRLMTHFASANLLSGDSVPQQMDAFLAAIEGIPGERSMANSCAILGWPHSHAEWVRPGLLLYGVSPFTDQTAADIGLVPALTVTSALIAVKQVPAGGRVGYGESFACPEAMPIGIVAFGYADGYPRHASTGTPILVNGVRTRVIGDVTMDMMMVDLRPVPSARVGDPVVLWGEGLPVEEIAHAAATIPYELLCRMRMRAKFVELPA